MSTPTLTAPTDTTGWLLEMTGTGDNTIYKAVDQENGRGIAVAQRLSHGTWLLVPLTFYCGEEDGLPPLEFDDDDTAVKWLTYLANLYTRPVTA